MLYLPIPDTTPGTGIGLPPHGPPKPPQLIGIYGSRIRRVWDPILGSLNVAVNVGEQTRRIRTPEIYSLPLSSRYSGRGLPNDPDETGDETVAPALRSGDETGQIDEPQGSGDRSDGTCVLFFICLVVP